MSSNDEELLKAETNDLKACRDPTGGLRREGLISFKWAWTAESPVGYKGNPTIRVLLQTWFLHERKKEELAEHSNGHLLLYLKGIRKLGL